MKKSAVIFISLIIGLIIVVALYQKVGVEDIIHQLQKLHYWQLLVIAIIAFLIMWLGLWRWKLILKHFAHADVSWRTIIRARIGELAVSYWAPLMFIGGEGLRAYVVKKEHDVPLIHGLTSVMLDRVAEIIAFLIFVSFGAIILLAQRSFLWGILLIIVAGIIFLALYLMLGLVGLDKILLVLSKIPRLAGIRYRIGQTKISERITVVAEQTSAYLKHSRSKFILNVFMSCLILFLWLLQNKLLMEFFGLSVPWSKLFILKIFFAVVAFIPIPANLGSYEGAYVLFFAMFGVPADTALAFSLVTRAIELSWATIGVFLISHIAIEALSNLSNLFSDRENEDATN